MGSRSALARQGAAVVVNDLDADRADEVVTELGATGAAAVAAAFDVGDHDAVRRGVASAVESHGPIDVLVNNAGIPPGMTLQPFRDTTPAEWQAYFDVNTLGVMHCCHAVLDGMRRSSWGRIVTISSGAATIGSRFGTSIYGASKGGAIAFTRNLAQEEARQGITVNTVALGLMDTVESDDAGLDAAGRSVPVGRLGRPADAGALCAYLASNEAGWMTGQTLQLNGERPRPDRVPARRRWIPGGRAQGVQWSRR